MGLDDSRAFTRLSAAPKYQSQGFWLCTGLLPLGGLLVGVAETFGAAYISGSHKDIYAFILLILVLMIRPSGIMGVIVKVKA